MNNLDEQTLKCWRNNISDKNNIVSAFVSKQVQKECEKPGCDDNPEDIEQYILELLKERYDEGTVLSKEYISAIIENFKDLQDYDKYLKGWEKGKDLEFDDSVFKLVQEWSLILCKSKRYIDESDSICQFCCLKLRKGQFKGLSPLKNYVCKIITHEIYSRFKKGKKITNVESWDKHIEKTKKSQSREDWEEENKYLIVEHVQHRVLEEKHFRSEVAKRPILEQIIIEKTLDYHGSKAQSTRKIQREITKESNGKYTRYAVEQAIKRLKPFLVRYGYEGI